MLRHLPSVLSPCQKPSPLHFTSIPQYHIKKKIRASPYSESMCCAWVHLATTSQHSNYVPLEVYKHPQTAMQMKTKSSRWLRTSKRKILSIITSTLSRINDVVQWHRGTYTLPSAGIYKGSEQIHNCRFVKLYLFFFFFLYGLKTWKLVWKGKWWWVSIVHSLKNHRPVISTRLI